MISAYEGGQGILLPNSAPMLVHPESFAVFVAFATSPSCFVMLSKKPPIAQLITLSTAIRNLNSSS